MKTHAIVNNIHVSSRKAKLVVDLIRGKKVNDAIRILETTNKKSSGILKKLLNSAIANATNNHSMNGQLLYVYEVFANEGKTMKRIMPRAKGSADTIFKRTTNFKIVLSDDVNERQKDLQKIKDLIKKRAVNNSKKTEVVQKVETSKESPKTTEKKTSPKSKPKTTSKTVKKGDTK